MIKGKFKRICFRLIGFFEMFFLEIFYDICLYFICRRVVLCLCLVVRDFGKCVVIVSGIVKWIILEF